MATESKQREPLTLQQYLILSVMSFRGEGVPYQMDDLTRDVGIAKAWVDQWDGDPVNDYWRALVLSGHLFLGVVEGKIAFRPSGKVPPADASPAAGDRGGAG